ncbi:MAG: phosphoribosyltransferase family protein [Alistipes sp.]
MSILSNLFADLRALFFPPLCPVCGQVKGEGGGSICTHCRTEVPLTGFWCELDNPLSQRLWGMIPVVRASAFIYYVRGSGWRRLIHSFKYRGAWRLAREMGCWYGSYLKDSEQYEDIDLIVPIPLHLFRLLHRGYNQSDYIAQGIASQLGVRVETHAVVRHRNNPSQAHSRRSDRWNNVNNLFAVRKPEHLAGKHILLVDDVCTTSATLVSCAEEILRAVPDCRISVAVLAVSQRELGIDR